MYPLKYKNVNYFRLSKLMRVSSGLNIGIFGGSFNPPHAGHLYACMQAKKKLKLDLIFWLVSPLNPLKTHNFDILPLKNRIKLCEQMVKNHQYIKIISIEDSFNLNYSYYTLKKIKELSHASNKLFWIMGEDNLAIFHLFYQWKRIIAENNIVVLARSQQTFKSVLQKASLFYKRRYPQHIKLYLIPKNTLSSTKIRNSNKLKDNV